MYQRGFTHALRWNKWDFERIIPYENTLEKLYGNMSYDFDRSIWAGTFGARDRRTGSMPYYVYLRNEEMLTAVLLCAGVTE